MIPTMVGSGPVPTPPPPSVGVVVGRVGRGFLVVVVVSGGGAGGPVSSQSGGGAGGPTVDVGGGSVEMTPTGGSGPDVDDPEQSVLYAQSHVDTAVFQTRGGAQLISKRTP